MILRVRSCLGILCQTGPLDFLDLFQDLYVDAIGIINPAGGIGAGDGLCAQLPCFLDGVGCHIAGAGNCHGLARQGMAVALEHFLCQIQQAVTGGFFSCQAAAVGQTLTGENALVNAPDALILAVEVADFPGACADITGRNVHICANVLIQLCHKTLAERHDLPIRLALGVKVRAALGAADGQTGQAVLEHLLKAQKLHNALVDRGVQTDAALVRADGIVKLHTVGLVYLNLPLIVHPGYPEFHDPIRLGHPFQQSFPTVFFFILFNGRPEGFQHFLHSLVKFRLIGVLCNDFF